MTKISRPLVYNSQSSSLSFPPRRGGITPDLLTVTEPSPGTRDPPVPGFSTHRSGNSDGARWGLREHGLGLRPGVRTETEACVVKT